MLISGKLTSVAGNGYFHYGDGLGTMALFYNPYSLDVDLARNIYVADTSNYRIRKISSSGIHVFSMLRFSGVIPSFMT